jgi:hypothetical protein
VPDVISIRIKWNSPAHNQRVETPCVDESVTNVNHYSMRIFYRDVNFLKLLLNDFCALLPCLIALIGNCLKNEGLAVID